MTKQTTDKLSRAPKPSKVTKVTQIVPKLRPKTKAFIDLLDSNPKLSQATAYKMTHETVNSDTAKANASRTLASANVIIYRKQHEQMAKQTIVEIAMNKKAKDTDRIKAAQDVLDRNLGKATLKTEANITNLNLNIEASEELNQQFTEFLKGQSQA